MRHSSPLKFGPLSTAILAASLVVFAQNPAPQDDGSAKESPGMPPRATATEYSSHASAGTFSIGADFTAHLAAMPDGTLSTEDYLVIETGLFGAPDAKLKLSLEDFSLRINGKKMPLPAQPYGLVAKTLKDPDAAPPAKSDKGKTSVGSGGGGQADNEPPPIVHIPVETRRAWTQRLQKASLPEGERPLPQAGLIYFPYGGKPKGIRSMELIYSGPAGTATLTLQP
jgi:hypothetical protein